MKKRVLYINYMLQYGHINFDHIHINALMRQGYEVKVIIPSKVFERMSLPKDIILLLLPECLDCGSSNGFVNRIMYVLTLLYIHLKIDVAGFDHVIVSNVEEISLCLVSLGKDMLLFKHSPYESLRNKFKCFFMKRLALKNRFVVFNENMRIPFSDVGISNVAVISHGYMPPFQYNECEVLPEGINNSKRIVFHPSDRPNHRFIEELLRNSNVQKHLEKYDAIMVLRDRTGKYVSNGRIRVITDYIPDAIYRNLFLRADIVLLAYPEEFLYRVSGVSYECFINKKKMLILDNPSFYYCSEYYNYDPMFNSVDRLLTKMEELFINSQLCFKADISKLTPDYTSVFNS